jgi:hypothetical protein
MNAFWVIPAQRKQGYQRAHFLSPQSDLIFPVACLFEVVEMN